MLGLANINYHFANRGNSISDKIILALEWYDSGLQAIRPRDAFYRFIFCINGILSWGTNAIHKAKELEQRYEKLLQSNEHSFYSNGILLSNDSASRLKELYCQQRNSIAHGYSSNTRFPLTLINVEEAELLARNAILLMMQTIQNNSEWIKPEDIEIWMQIKPPKK